MRGFVGAGGNGKAKSEDEKKSDTIAIHETT
jgi:hypothetical protein